MSEPQQRPRFYLIFAPYQEDVGAALQKLREEMFERGEYTFDMTDKATTVWKMIGWTIEDPTSEEGKAEVEAQKRVLAAAQKDNFEGLTSEEEDLAKHLQTVLGMLAVAGVKDVKVPQSIEELLEAAGEEGTRSILDIEKVGRKPATGVAGYLPSQEMWVTFGNTQPTREQVLERWTSLARHLGRWEAIYLTVYKDHLPSEYAFIGCAGD